MCAVEDFFPRSVFEVNKGSDGGLAPSDLLRCDNELLLWWNGALVLYFLSRWS